MTPDDMRLCDDADILIEPLAPAADAGAGALALAGGRLSFRRMRIFITEDDGTRTIEEIDTASADAFAARLPAALALKYRATLANITAPRPPMTIANSAIPTGFGRPLVMGILNVTPDSFSDGGVHGTVDAAIAHGRSMLAAGADIIDIGGESTRPGAKTVWEEEERRRVLPVVRALASEGAVISIDSRKASVMAAALEAGARIVNDVSALCYDPDSVNVVRDSGAPLILMHAKGEPHNMQESPHYEDVVRETFSFLGERMAHAISAGIAKDRLIIDPGIGFGKSVRHNLDLLNALAAFHGHGVPLLIGVSRKRFIGALSRGEAATDRLGGSLAAAMQALAAGAHILRVHDVAGTVQAVRIREGLVDAATMRRHELAHGSHRDRGEVE